MIKIKRKNLEYSVLIIGGGIAGCTTAIYLKRAGFNVAIVTDDAIGGTLNGIDLIENYSGVPSITGEELSDNLLQQLNDLDIDIYEDTKIINVEKLKGIFLSESKDMAILSKYLVFATGVKHNKLKIKNNVKFPMNQSHCVLCDGYMHKDKDVLVVGGGNSALTEAIELSKTSKKVYLIHRRKEFTAEKTLLDKVNIIDNIEIVYGNIDSIVKYDEEKQSYDIIYRTLENEKNKKNITDISGLFVYIGSKPNTNLLQKYNKNEKILSSDGEVLVHDTRVFFEKNMYACGDILYSSPRQIGSAVGDGVMVAKRIIWNNNNEDK